MTTLAIQQQALLSALFDWPPQEAAARLQPLAVGVGTNPGRGLKAYQANGHMLAERALRATYPVLVQMLGDESFADLARALWHAHPPVRGDIAQWGVELPDFVHRSEQLQDAPYLLDVTRTEWALHSCATAPDRDADLATLSLLTTDDPESLALQLAPGLFTLSSRWPLASIMQAHLEGIPSFVELGAQMRSCVAQDVVVWRDGLKARVRLALPSELALLQAMQQGVALETAVEAAPGLDLSQWLPLAVQTGLVLGASRQSEVWAQEKT